MVEGGEDLIKLREIDGAANVDNSVGSDQVTEHTLTLIVSRGVRNVALGKCTLNR